MGAKKMPLRKAHIEMSLKAKRKSTEQKQSNMNKPIGFKLCFKVKHMLFV